MRQKFLTLFAGMVLGAALFGSSAAAASKVMARMSTQVFYVDGQQVTMTAYDIGGNNYVMLRDVGKAVGFNVYWDRSRGAVQVETDQPYTGTAPKNEPAPTSPSQTASTSQTTDAIRQEIIDRTNALRQQNGLPALGTDPLLTQAAQVRADEMAATGTYSHTRPDGRKSATVTDCPYVAENIHCIPLWCLDGESELARTAVDEWAASAGHLKNILKTQASAMGVGLARGLDPEGQECWYLVQLFLYEGQVIRWVDKPAAIK